MLPAETKALPPPKSQFRLHACTFSEEERSVLIAPLATLDERSLREACYV